MRPSSCSSAIRHAALVTALFAATASAPVAARSAGTPDDAANRRAASAVRSSALRASRIAQGIRDAVRIAPGDSASRGESLLVPYREVTSPDALQNGFAMQLPGTGLALTNGSFWLRRTSDARHASGIHVSVQLTY